jgi:hypothetical protein
MSRYNELGKRSAAMKKPKMTLAQTAIVCAILSFCLAPVWLVLSPFFNFCSQSFGQLENREGLPINKVKMNVKHNRQEWIHEDDGKVTVKDNGKIMPYYKDGTYYHAVNGTLIPYYTR